MLNIWCCTVSGPRSIDRFRSSPDWGSSVVFLGKTFHSHGASLRTGV